MRRSHVLGLLFPFLLSILLTVPVKSSQHDIRPGSSISACNFPKYWLSPSGTFAFGFHPSCDGCTTCRIGIWLPKSYNKNLTWVHPCQASHGSSIVFNHHIGLLLRHDEIEDIMLFGNDTIATPAYASMHDSGNFVLYDSNSHIIWQSFDHPINTIVSGQNLKSGHSLISMSSSLLDPWSFHLSMNVDGNLVVVGPPPPKSLFGAEVVWESKTYARNRSVGLSLDNKGRLYLADKEGIVLKNLTKGELVQAPNSGNIVYRATMESDGIFSLYRETPDELPQVIWHTRDPPISKEIVFFLVLYFLFAAIIIVIAVVYRYKSFNWSGFDQEKDSVSKEPLLYNDKQSSTLNGLDPERDLELQYDEVIQPDATERVSCHEALRSR